MLDQSSPVARESRLVYTGYYPIVLAHAQSLMTTDQAGATAFSPGLDLVEPGVVPLVTWRPDGGTPSDPLAAHSYAAMGRKP
jgi:S-adenosyl methyltransferase